MTDSTTRNILLTGGTGFLGKAVVARLMNKSWVGKVYLLVRPRMGIEVEQRVERVLTGIFPRGRHEELRGRIIAVEGDLTKAGLGLSRESRQLLREEIDQIVHVGASTDFGAPIGESRLYNVEGTRHVLELALQLKATGRAQRFDYVSTAYVAGTLRGDVCEDDLVRGQSFANNYEQSKYEAEILVRRHRHDIPTVIYRPSIVVGDSKNGFTPHFKVLYWPLLLLSKSLLPFFATNRRGLLDVVPVDYVADGMVALMKEKEALNGTYYLTAGRGHEVCIAEMLRDAYTIAKIKPRPIIPFWLFNFVKNSPLRRFFSEAFWDAADLAKPYECYLRGTGVRFDSQRSAAVLSRLGVRAPLWDSYKREVLGYCKASRWGKKLPMPEYAYYLPVSHTKERYEPATTNTGAPGLIGAPAGQNA